MRASYLRLIALFAAAFVTSWTPGFAEQAPKAASNGGLELVMVERQGCGWCQRWLRDVGPIYPKTPEGARAPLRRHDLANGQPEGLVSPAVYTPTFVLLRDRREVGRIVGYADDSTFWGLLGAMLKREENAAVPLDDVAPQSALAGQRG